MFTVVVLSDIHGNAAAMRAVLDDVRRSPYDRMAVAGDLVYGGPRPAEALALIRGLDADVVYGNADRAVVTEDIPWVREAVGPDGLAYLAGLPFSHRVTPPGGVSPGDDLLIVHATPADVEGILTVAPDPFGTFSVTPEAEARRLLGGAEACLIVSGHVHYASEGRAAGRRFASIGSVGLPFDGDPRAAYARVTWDGAAWTIANVRVPYDHRAVTAEARACGAPFAETTVRRLETSRI